MKLLWLACPFVFVLAYVLTPPVIALAWKIRAVDVPMDGRRMHCVAIPRNGGLAIFPAFLAGCALFVHGNGELTRVLLGASFLLCAGLADDVRSLPPAVKLLFQIAAALLGCGIPQNFAGVAAVLWVVALINAHNFIDGLDGLLSGVAAIEGVFLGVAIFLTGGTAETILPPLLLSSACLAFRLFNRFPAQVFAGDCGSETVGYLLACLSLPLFGASDWSVGVLSPFFLFAYPLTELSASVVRRLLRGHSPFLADRGHFHHRICAAGVTQVQCVGLLTAVAASVGAVGIFLSMREWELAAGISCFIAVLLLIRVRRFIAAFEK